MSYERKSTIKLSGKQGLAALVVVALLAGYRFVSLQNITDAGLQKQVVETLASDVRRAAIVELATDQEALAEKLTDPGIRIVRIQMSKPLLSFKSSGKAIVKVDYRELGVAKVKYFEIRYSLVGGYQLKEEASSIEYYLSFAFT